MQVSGIWANDGLLQSVETALGAYAQHLSAILDMPVIFTIYKRKITFDMYRFFTLGITTVEKPNRWHTLTDTRLLPIVVAVVPEATNVNWFIRTDTDDVGCTFVVNDGIVVLSSCFQSFTSEAGHGSVVMVGVCHQID